MTDYTKTTDFTSKDSLPSGDSGKIIRGAEFGTEFDNIETAVNSKSNKENPSFTGNITVTGTVDGRDIAADGTKLDTIETSADVTDTANVTAAGAVMDSELTDITAVKALNQGVATTDSPTFAAVTSTGNVTVGGTVDGRDVAADGTKLDTVETNADVTDTTNVTAAGALMDSEVTNLDQVKAFDSADYATAAQGTTADNALPRTGGAMTGAITTNSTFDGRDVATDGAKLDGIEASADVTDTANVTAAGALMDSELTSEASVKALNQGVATTDSPTFAGATVNGTVEFDGLSGTGAVTVTDILDQDDMSGNSATALATQQSIKSYVDSQVATSDTLAEVLANGNATGGTDVAFGDNDKAIFGSATDLSIYSDGTNSFIQEGSGTSGIRITTDNQLLIRKHDTETIAAFNVDGAVRLYHDNTARLATTSTGIDVTGTLVSDGLTVDGTATTAATFNTNVNGSQLVINDGTAGTQPWNVGVKNDGTNDFLIYNLGSENIELYTANSIRQKIASNGDISFYEDTGTSPKMVWKSADERLGVGNASPTRDLTVGDTAVSSYINIKSSATNGISGLGFGDSGDDNRAQIVFDNSTDKLQIQNGGGGALGNRGITLDSSENVGIGTSSPVRPLSVKASQEQLTLSEGDVRGATFDYRSSTGNLNIATNGINARTSPQFTLDLNGNVGIGGTPSSWSSAFTALQIEGSSVWSTGGDVALAANNYYNGTQYKYVNNGAASRQYHNTDGSVAWFQAGSGTAGATISFTQAMTLDASGNLLVGTTDSNVTNNSGPASQAGINIGTAGIKGLIASARYQGPPLALNRLNNDGSIAEFSKDGTPVGSISSHTGGFLKIDTAGDSSGLLFGTSAIYPIKNDVIDDAAVDLGDGSNRFKDLYLSNEVIFGSSTGSIGVSGSYLAIGNASGLRFDDSLNRILPFNTETPTATNGTLDIGSAGARFKDLYLAGGVLLGGTGSANKLDDYEEGTWTPTIKAGGTLTISSISSATYTKIGRLVTVQAYINLNDDGNAGSTILLGIPFAGITNQYFTGVLTHSAGSNTTDTMYIRQSSGSSEMAVFKGSSTSVAQSEIDGGWIIFSLTYQTNS